MARLFDDGSNEYLELDSAPIVAAPFTMACWFNSDNIALDQTLMFVGDKNFNNRRWNLSIRGDIGGNPIYMVVVDSAGVGVAATSTGYSPNTWHHACGVEAAATDRRVFIDGGSKGINAANRTPASVNRVSIGRVGRTSPFAYMSGLIAEAAIWKVALSDAEVALLAKGFSPLFIQPHNLVRYYPLIRDDDNDWIGGFDLAAFNTPTVAAHPPLIVYPAFQQA